MQALPTILSRHSQYFNQTANRFFTSYSDKHGGKMNTARVVGVKELGIDLSYTIESSFYSYPIITETGQRKKGLMNYNSMMKAGFDLLQGIFNVTFTT